MSQTSRSRHNTNHDGSNQESSHGQYSVGFFLSPPQRPQGPPHGSNDSNETPTSNEPPTPTPTPTPPRLTFHANLGCGICFEAVSNPLLAFPMRCCHHTHILHHACAVTWFHRQRQDHQAPSCPFCRAQVLSISQWDELFTYSSHPTPKDLDLSHTQHSSLEPVYADADGPVPYFSNHPSLHTLQLVQLTHASYGLMVANLIFIVYLLSCVV